MFSKPETISAPGSTIDSSTSAGFWPGRFSSRLGPTVPEEPAASSVWQEPQPLSAKTCPPSPPGATGGSMPGTPATLPT